MLPNGAIGVRFSPGGDTMYVTDATGLGIYDVAEPGLAADAAATCRCPARPTT